MTRDLFGELATPAAKRVLVCGGRFYADRARLFAEMDALHALHGFEVVIQGEADGADKLSRQWAEARGIAVDPYPADWQRLGRAAGMRRNRVMLQRGRPDIVVAFPGDVGTAGMVRIARAAGVRVIEIPL